jgi:hypothetical protein
LVRGATFRMPHLCTPCMLHLCTSVTFRRPHLCTRCMLRLCTSVTFRMPHLCACCMLHLCTSVTFRTPHPCTRCMLHLCTSVTFCTPHPRTLCHTLRTTLCTLCPVCDIYVQKMSPEKWEEAVNRIGREWQKGTDTKTGTRRVHSVVPLAQVIMLAEAAQAAVACSGSAGGHSCSDSDDSGD